jgi:hypothetical protein
VSYDLGVSKGSFAIFLRSLRNGVKKAPYPQRPRRTREPQSTTGIDTSEPVIIYPEQNHRHLRSKLCRSIRLVFQMALFSFFTQGLSLILRNFFHAAALLILHRRILDRF